MSQEAKRSQPSFNKGAQGKLRTVAYKSEETSLNDALWHQIEPFSGMIETNYGIELSQGNGKLLITGKDASAVAAAKTLFQQLSTEQENKIKKARLNTLFNEFKAKDFRKKKDIIRVSGKTIKAKSENQRRYIESLSASDLTFGTGPAGTGKTYLAVAKAVEMLEKKHINKIILTRPAVEAGENLGFLPGNEKEKVAPYLRPLFDFLEDLIGKEKMEEYIKEGILEIEPIAFMRGRTFDNAAIVVDEAQNMTPAQIKMVITRLGMNSRMAICGDPTQNDLGKDRQGKQIKSGLVWAIEKLRQLENEGISFCELDGEDIVRHPLLRKIICAFEGEDLDEDIPLPDNILK